MPWYSEGTVQLAANGTIVTGTGTQFLTNIRIGDGLVIQGSTALHEVIGIASENQLTIRPAYAGTAGSGKQYAAAPLLGYDKDLSDAFNQLRLQFGGQLSALQPWAYAATANAALDALGFSATGKAVATGSASAGRGALGLGSSAVRSEVGSTLDATPDRVLKTKSFGVGSLGLQTDTAIGSPDLAVAAGFYFISGAAEAGTGQNSQIISLPRSSNNGGQIALSDHQVRAWIRARPSSGWTSWAELLHQHNTTTDSNGFVKSASPIIQLYSDRITCNGLADSAEFTHLGTGHYQLTDTNGLRLDDGWYIETPHDRNKVPYFNVDWEQDIEPETEAGILEEAANVTLTIRCYERVWNPQTGQYDNGDPVDIPDGRWIDLRLNEVREPEPEEVDEPEAAPVPADPAAPTIPYVVTMAQAKLALYYAGLLHLVEDAINALPEAERTTALIEWNHRLTLERSHPLVAQVAAALELTEQRLDELFVDAAGR